MTCRFTSAALEELRAACLDHEEKEPGLGLRFLNEVDSATERILDNPNAWRRMSSRTRRCMVRRFPFGLFYQIRKGEILVLSVMDLRRDPVSWQAHL